jgi:dTDP-4-dehydrorhamnose 3,5-epimerase
VTCELKVKFLSTKFDQAWLIEPECHTDERGFFARTWCEREFLSRGLNSRLVQCNVSFNREAGTLRGMHMQQAPHEEAKLVSCPRGSIYDVIVDMRLGSSTFLTWQWFELTAENKCSLYIPEGFAHGFLTLEECTDVFYQMSEFHHAECAVGYRWDDPALGIKWPMDPRVITARDANYAGCTARVSSSRQQDEFAVI